MWFKSKLENPDPEIRRQHIEHLAPEDDLLIQIARTDPHPDVRSAALSRLVDMSALEALARDDQEERIRTLAIARLQRLLSGAESPSPPIDARVAFLAASKDERLIRFVARSAAEPELRKVAVDSLLSRQDDSAVQDLLCEIAADDAVQEIREKAAQPIRDMERLQTLLEKSRGRDKSIHRLARERLDTIQAQLDARELLNKTCHDIEQLCDHHFSADGKVEEARLARIVSDWDAAAAIVDPVDRQLLKRYSTARNSIEANLAELAEQRRQRSEILAALSLHLTDKDSEPVGGLIKRWHDLDEPSVQQAREFAKLVTEATEHDSQRERDSHRVVAKQALLEKMEQAAAAQSLRQAVLTRFEERWDATPEPDDEAQSEELKNAYLSLREKLRAKLEKQASALEERLAKVVALLEQYDTALEEGKLQVIVSTHDKTVNALRHLEAPQGRKQELLQRLRAGEPRMAELRQWRHWGTERKREELCERVETLLTAGMKIPDVAKAVRESREAWKTLDKSDGPSGKKLWRRFDEACEKAYEPCQAHFDQQKSQRKENMAKRIAICEILETLAKETDWEAPSWRELSDALRETQRQWHVAGSVDRREKNTIQKRYDEARGAIDEHLNAKRQQEIDRREALIRTVEELAGAEDTGRAVDAAKRAQRDWKPLVQAGRGKEQDLWKRFRAACDAIFERRKEQFAAADGERTQNLGEKLAVCGQIEEIAGTLKTHLDTATGDSGLVAESRKKVRALGSGWQRIGAVPRDKQQQIDKRFQQCCKETEQLCNSLDRQLKKQAAKILRDAASDCDNLELAVAAEEGIEAAAVGQIMDSLGSIADNGLIQRIKRLQAAAGGDARAQQEIRDALPSNLETRRRICLEMEIAASIDSPQKYRDERMQYRVRQLSESMSGNRKQMTPAELERSWYETGPVAQADRSELDERFQRALEALGAD